MFIEYGFQLAEVNDGVPCYRNEFNLVAKFCKQGFRSENAMMLNATEDDSISVWILVGKGGANNGKVRRFGAPTGEYDFSKFAPQCSGNILTCLVDNLLAFAPFRVQA